MNSTIFGLKCLREYWESLDEEQVKGKLKDAVIESIHSFLFCGFRPVGRFIWGCNIWRNNFEELDTIFFSWYLFVSGLLSLEFMPILRITVVGVWRGFHG